MQFISKQEEDLWNLLIMLLDDQEGAKHELHFVKDREDKTA